MPLQLNYRSIEGRRELSPTWRSVCFKISAACWALPLLAGLLTFLIWTVVRWRPLTSLGLLIILIGVLLTAVGGIATLVLLITRWSNSSRPWRQAVLPAIGLLFLLLSNFFIASMLIQLAFWIDPDVIGHHGK